MYHFRSISLGGLGLLAWACLAQAAALVGLEDGRHTVPLGVAGRPPAPGPWLS